MIHIPRADFARIRALAKSRKDKRDEKRLTLPWSGQEKRPRSGSLYKWWASRLDSLWGKVVRARDIYLFGNVCRIRKAKNCTGRAEVGYHLVSKARGHAVRWALTAGVAACGPCNDGERLNRVLYDEHHRNIFGEEFIAELKRLSHQTLKVGPEIMKDMAAEFQRLEAHYLTLSQRPKEASEKPSSPFPSSGASAPGPTGSDGDAASAALEKP